ncbi:MAG TPA: hypothetical protein VEX57_01010, partial [Microlunatus sp.]|nr:hypothetical protein [Microlunatus sp.]
PQETYSTSEHLFHDQGIDRTVTGRLVPLPPREPSARSGRDNRPGRSDFDRSGSERSAEDEATQDAQREQRRKERPKRDRTRRRLRNGVAVEAGAETADGGSTADEAVAPSEPTAPVDNDQTSASAASQGDAPKRRRRRRRGGSGKADPAEQNEAGSPTEGDSSGAANTAASA